MIRIEYWTRWNNYIRRIMHVAPPVCDILGVYYNKGRIPPKYTKMPKKWSKNGGMSKSFSVSLTTTERQVFSDFRPKQAIIIGSYALLHDFACLSEPNFAVFTP